jgi:hypothetical protein
MIARRGRLDIRVAALVAIGTAAGLYAPAARAAGQGGRVGRVGVVVLRGAGEGQVRARIANALKSNGFQVVGGQQLESTASSLGVSLEADAGFRAVAKELNISAFVSGEVGRKRAEISVRNGADGAVLGEASFAGANPKKIAAQVGSDFWRQLGGAIKQGKPPSGAKTKVVIPEQAAAADEAEASEPSPPPEPRKKSGRSADKRAEQGSAEPGPKSESAEAEGDAKPAKKSGEAASEAEESSASATSSRSAAGLPALSLGVGGRALFRRLDWNQDPARRLPPYSLSPGPEASVWLEAYPGALYGKGFAANVGVFGGFNLGFGVTSSTTDGARLTTKFQDFMGGLKVRLPLERLAPYLSVAYGAQSFKLESSTGTSVIPSVAYKFIRIGVGTRIALTPVAALDLGAAYLLVTDAGSKTGEIKSMAYFPNTKAYAVDLGASVGYRLSRLIGARVGVDFRQYGLDFKVKQGDPLIVGGAKDRYITVGAGVEIVLDSPGTTGTTAGEGDDEKEPEAAAPTPTASKRRKAAPADQAPEGAEESK